MSALAYAMPPRSATGKSVLIISPDTDLRTRLCRELSGMRWKTRAVGGGAEAMLALDTEGAEAVMLDHWLPDLEVASFCRELRRQYPLLDVVPLDGGVVADAPRCPNRNELLHALREVHKDEPVVPESKVAAIALPREAIDELHSTEMEIIAHLPAMVGDTEPMRELARLVRLVAPHDVPVLIEGETGTGKELVAQAVHRLSQRSHRSFVVLNCAAIPEALLEAELFGHVRGAFTGAVQSRAGRIEAADGGTLFLDEIGEMPLALQSKLLRFLENGELQRVGDNSVLKVDVRVVAATHQPLRHNAAEGKFRLDLYHRLAVFPVVMPPLRDRAEDVPMLVAAMLERLAEHAPLKRITTAALAQLAAYRWPGNVRELWHVLRRAVILADQNHVIGEAHIQL